MRGTVAVSPSITQDDAVQAALAVPNVSKFTQDKAVKKVVFVPGKILNLIVG